MIKNNKSKVFLYVLILIIFLAFPLVLILHPYFKSILLGHLTMIYFGYLGVVSLLAGISSGLNIKNIYLKIITMLDVFVLTFICLAIFCMLLSGQLIYLLTDRMISTGYWILVLPVISTLIVSVSLYHIFGFKRKSKDEQNQFNQFNLSDYMIGNNKVIKTDETMCGHRVYKDAQGIEYFSTDGMNYSADCHFELNGKTILRSNQLRGFRTYKDSNGNVYFADKTNHITKG